MTAYYGEMIPCIECGIEFGMPDSLEKQRLADHKPFWCPNGHKQFFTGKTPEEKRIEELEDRNRSLKNDVDVLGRMAQAYKCPIAQCQFGTKTKTRLREHLAGEHRVVFQTLALAADAGPDAMGSGAPVVEILAGRRRKS